MGELRSRFVSKFIQWESIRPDKFDCRGLLLFRIIEVTAQPDLTLSIVADDGRIGKFDIKPYLSI